MARLGPNSRFRLSFQVEDEERNLTYNLIRNKRLEFDPNAANTVYIGVSGDNLFSVAARHFTGYRRPASLYWLLGEYQPTPVLDPRENLEGRIIYVPPTSKVAALLRSDETVG